MSDPSVDHPTEHEPDAEAEADAEPDARTEHEPEHEPEGWKPLGEDDSSTTHGGTGAAGEAEPLPRTMIPARATRQTALERVSMRLLATGGIVGLATAMAAIMVAKDVAGWVVGLVVGLVSVALAAILWSSRQL
jgi:hypothetical protein